MDLSDLSIPWLESPFFEKVLTRSDLDEATRGMVRSFAADGFLTFDPEIPDFDTVAAEIIAACSKRPGYPERVADAWAEIEGVRRRGDDRFRWVPVCPASEARWRDPG